MFKEYKNGNGVLNYTFDPEKEFQLEQILIHLDTASATAENLTITIKDVNGDVYNTIIDTKAMNTIQDYDYHPTRPKECWKGDKILLSWANTNNRTYGIVIKYK